MLTSLAFSNLRFKVSLELPKLALVMFREFVLSPINSKNFRILRFVRVILPLEFSVKIFSRSLKFSKFKVKSPSELMIKFSIF